MKSDHFKNVFGNAIAYSIIYSIIFCTLASFLCNLIEGTRSLVCKHIADAGIVRG